MTDLTWAVGLPNSLINFLIKNNLRDRARVWELLVSGEIHWKSSKGLGKEGYIKLCRWAGYDPPVEQLERVTPAHIKRSIKLLKKLGYQIYYYDHGPL